MSQPKETLHPGRSADFGRDPEPPKKATKKPAKTTEAEDAAPEEE